MPPSFDPESTRQEAQSALALIRSAASGKKNLLSLYKEYLKTERAHLREFHASGGSGVAVASRRAAVVDVLLTDAFACLLEEAGISRTTVPPASIVASGGYGRGHLNPGSDIDLQILVPGSSHELDPTLEAAINQLSLLLFDLGLEVSYPVRSIGEACTFANQDHRTKTALLDTRLITGDRELFHAFEDAFFHECIRGHEKSYLAQRTQDIRHRHEKHGRTVHLQEPNVKEGCGGLRDFHNLVWVMQVLSHSRELEPLVQQGRITEAACEEMREAFDFLMRVRTDLHYSQKGSVNDVLTLRLQGIIATNLHYEGNTIIRRSEAFMRDYYHHTRNLFQHTTSLMQGFELQVVGDDTTRVPLFNLLARQRSTAIGSFDSFDGFHVRGEFIYPDHEDIFAEDPRRLIRFFLHLQRRNLRTSPEIRQLLKANLPLVDGNFRRSKSNRETLEEILQNRGQVATTFRQMHRIGFLGSYFPEFGQLTDLVQHEFFHRYSADEHTLRCIEVLDSLVHSDDPKEQFFRKIFQDMEDPVALYIALLLHDTGRAEGVRHHDSASAVLAAKVCKRLNYHGDRLRMIIFLVDHHLTFWRTATTKDLTDLGTITDFAAAVRTTRWLEALHLFTYVDSKGTSEIAWTDWKASLMQQLHRRTAAYFADQQKYCREFTPPRDETRQKVLSKLPESYSEEVEAHFQLMPDRYFRHRGASSIVRQIRLFRRFFKLFSRPTADSLVPVVGWEARPGEGYTLLEVVGWNRHHLLAKVVGALAARNINILSADLYSRADDLVLNVFRVCTATLNPITSAREIERIEKLLHDQFSIESVGGDFRALIAQQAAPSIIEYQRLDFDIPQRVYLSNEDHPDTTVLEVQAKDRIGLLYDIFSTLGDLDAEVRHARISTQAGAAIDRFFLVDSASEKKIRGAERLRHLAESVEKCLEKRTEPTT